MPPLPSPKVEITEERAIVGEGVSDAAFFRFLCQVRNINGFDIHNVSGKSSFGNRLTALKGLAGTKLRSVIVVADNDETPADSFKNVRGQIPDGWPHPNAQLEKARIEKGHKPETPYIVIIMLPFPKIGASSHGCLESMLLQAAEPTLAVQTNCLNGYCGCIGTGDWSITARDKMRLQCLMSASFPEDPNAGVQYSLKPERGLIPLTHPYFNELGDLLTNFDVWMASPHASWDAWKASRAAAASPRAG
ncbi:MAG: DUF3226 domain-containing protein [Terriglobales bacterium]